LIGLGVRKLSKSKTIVPVNPQSIVEYSIVNETKENNIPTWEEFLSYGKEKEPTVNIKALKNKYDAWVVNGWKNGNDRQIKNWKSALLQTLIYIEKNNTNTNGMVY